MRIPISWLRDFVDPPVDARALAEKLAMRGFETASVEERPAPPPAPWASAQDGTDAVIDFEITANRPDCFSVLGLAREVATTWRIDLRAPGSAPGLERQALTTGESDAVSVTIEDPDLCPRYAAAVADVTIGPSPPWLAARLEAAGVRPISNIVDITNYVLLEIGQPTHAFDLERLGGRALRIRRAKPGETLTTLDGVQRTLADDMLVIADAGRAQAVAGVMGGASSEVSPSSRRVVFESAYFKPTSVRRTSKRLGLMTEASARFERGGDINAPLLALERIGALLERLGAGRIVGPVVDRYPAPRGPVTIRLRRNRLASLLGVRVADEEVIRIFRGLGLDVASVKDGWDVTVPTFRVDLVREADLIEEVGRHYGYDQLPPVFPVPQSPTAPPDPRVARDRDVRRVLLAAGLSEAFTYSFIEQRTHEAFGLADEPEVVAIANPLSGKFEVLRRSLLPGLIDAVAHNRHHQRRDVRLFEVGACFSASAGEVRKVGLAWTGAASDDHWSGTRREVDFFDVKGLVERLGEVLGVPLLVEPASNAMLVPGRAARVAVDVAPYQGHPLGLLGQLLPGTAEARDVPPGDPVYVAELDLDAAWAARQAIERATGSTTTAVAPLPRFPSVVRDVSVLVNAGLPASEVRGTILTNAPEGLVDVTFFDRYQGKGIPEDQVSLSLRLTFRSPDRTLTDAEVQRGMDEIVALLARTHGAVQR